LPETPPAPPSDRPDRPGFEVSPIAAILIGLLVVGAAWALVAYGWIPARWRGPLFGLSFTSAMMSGLVHGVVQHIPRGTGPRRLVLYAVASLIGIYGFGGFFGGFLAASGALRVIGPSVEWPVGSVEPVAEDANGQLIVPVKYWSRVQIYDRTGRFVRGWSVDTAGREFTATPTSDGHVEVYIERRGRFVYSYEGQLLSETTDERREAGAAESGVQFRKTIRIPYSWPLWPLVGPLQAWITGLGGLYGAQWVGNGVGRRSFPRA